MLRTLSPIIFPNRPPFRRKVLLPEEHKNADFERNYDYNTLAYDIFVDQTKNLITLVCPKLYNFEYYVRNGCHQTSHEHLKIYAINKFRRHDEVYLKYKLDPHIFKFQYKDVCCSNDISQSDNLLFRKMNCATILSKDNALRWINDWVNFHIDHHNLEGLVFFDNESDEYSIQKLHDCLEAISGLKQFVVLAAPFRYGTFHKAKYVHRAKFLRAALLNVARKRFFAQAKAVLNIDIDELVAPLKGSNIFDETKKSLLGYRLFNGRWRHIANAPTKGVRHADHIYLTENDLCSATKYCIDPQGILSSRPWDVHRVLNGYLNKSLVSDKIFYYHCRQITTHWKYRREPAEENKLFTDEELQQAMLATFDKRPRRVED